MCSPFFILEKTTKNQKLSIHSVDILKRIKYIYLEIKINDFEAAVAW